MNKVTSVAAVAALINSASAIKQKSQDGPDVYGPNGSGYSNTRADYDFSRIGIDITKAGSGPKCKPGDWATVHWVGTLKDGRIITDSRAEPGSQPKTFAVGAREVFNCWDLAVQELHQGDTAHLSCPSYYAYGTAFAWAPIGGEPIPLGSDVDFDLEVVECNRVPELPDVQEAQAEAAKGPWTTTMQPGKCMYLHSVASDHESTPLVITCENEDKVNDPSFKNFPAAPCYLEEWVKDNKNQQFIFDRESGVIKDAAHSFELCKQGDELSICDFAAADGASAAFTKYHTKWRYDGVSQTLKHISDWGNSFPYVHNTAKWSQIFMDSNLHQDQHPTDNIDAKFRIEYCYKND